MFSTSGEIVDHFRSRSLSEESWSYIHTHAKRYAFLLEKVAAVESTLRNDKPITIMDVGPSFFTELLHLRYPRDLILTVGYETPESRGGHFPLCVVHGRIKHYHFNFNDAQYPEKWISPPQADLVVMAEVLEHLHTAPTLVLKFVHTLVRQGGFLILETPNAASLKKRMKLLAGRHPYEMIRENGNNPGHFREYTKSELLMVARTSGFDIRSCELSNYSSHDSSKGVVQRALRSVGPPGLRRGITLILEKPA